LLCVLALAQPVCADSSKLPPLVRSRQNGNWSAAATWEGGKVPGSGARVQVRPGHTVVYDVRSDRAIRSLHVGGTLTFAADRDTRLDTGLILVRPGEDATESGFDCDGHAPTPDGKAPRPVLAVGTPTQPIPPGRTALIRLVHFAGTDKES